MVKKFVSLLTNRTAWKLLRRSLIATLGFALVLYSDFSWWSLFIFFVALFFIYLRSGEDRKYVRILFWFFPLISVVGLSLLSSASSLLSFFSLVIAFCAAFAILNFVILGIINSSLFPNRFLVFNATQTIVFFLAFIVLQRLLLFSSLWIFAVFAVVVLFFKEAFLFFDPSLHKKIRLLSIASGVIVSEFILLTRFLPLSFLSASVFAALFSFLLRDGLAAHLKGKLFVSFVLREVTIFILFALIIFATAKWTI